LCPCHTCFGHVPKVRGHVTCYKTLGTCYLACYVPLGTHNMGVYGCKTGHGEKNRAKGQLRGKAYSSIRVLTALTTMGICKVRE